MTDISIDDVEFTYKAADEPALTGISCHIEQGSFIGVTGPSDSGKTSFCRLLPGFIPGFFTGDFAGQVTVGDLDTRQAGVGELGTTVGYVFEKPYDQLTGASTTVMEEVAFGLEQRGVKPSEIKSRVREKLALMNIEGLADRDPNNLSGGQLQRVAIASVLTLDPEVLVLDEPTSQLDPDGKAEVFEIAKQVNREGHTVVFVSQNLQNLAPLADRLLVFDDGSIVRDETPRDLLSDPSIDDRIRVPPTIRLGRSLRDNGVVPGDHPLPLTEADAVEEIEEFVDDSEHLSIVDEAGNEGRSGETSTGEPDHDRAHDGGQSPVDSGGDSHQRIELESLSHTYEGSVKALQDVSLTMDSGCIALLGHNGAGKSTLAKHLNGLLKPGSGRVLVRGTDTQQASVAALSRHVGLAFQDPDNQLFHSNIRNEVRFGPENLDLDQIETRVDRALTQLNLDSLEESNPYELGRLLRKRIALASVVAMDTPVVVLDEPTGGQDENGLAIIESLVEDLINEGKLVICITHDVEFAAKHADRIITLSDGQTVIDGDPVTVFSDETAMGETGLQAPVATRIGARFGLDGVLDVDDLITALIT
jgi:energy-coupling factor transporter ATP-binding protein EcfA2